MNYEYIDDSDEDDDEPFIPESIEFPIDGTLDLHTFNPKEVQSLIPDYLESCLEKGIYEVRIIHGKGRMVLARIVQSLLSSLPYVKSFAHPQDGRDVNTGVTIAKLWR